MTKGQSETTVNQTMTTVNDEGSLSYLIFQSFDLERHLMNLMLFQKRVVRSQLNIYVCIVIDNQITL